MCTRSVVNELCWFEPKVDLLLGTFYRVAAVDDVSVNNATLFNIKKKNSTSGKSGDEAPKATTLISGTALAQLHYKLCSLHPAGWGHGAILLQQPLPDLTWSSAT